jgi:hypothetical protein
MDIPLEIELFHDTCYQMVVQSLGSLKEVRVKEIRFKEIGVRDKRLLLNI